MNIYALLILAPILLVSLTVHEFSHGYVAYLLGDDTAKRAGRLTLNPLKHLDPIGLIVFIIFKFGWAKPVPINPYNFDNFKRDTAITAAAGPISNFILAIIAGLFFRLNILPYFPIVKIVLYYTVIYNLALGLFNLTPFPPMDGSKIIGGFLSDEIYEKYTAKEKTGMKIFVIFLLLNYIFKWNFIGIILYTPINFFTKIIIGIQ